jgi:hypothetical protein
MGPGKPHSIFRACLFYTLRDLLDCCDRCLQIISPIFSSSNLVMESLHATCSGVVSSLSPALTMTSLLSSSNLTTASCPFLAAIHSGVRPFLSFVLTSTFEESNRLTSDSRPFSAAESNAASSKLGPVLKSLESMVTAVILIRENGKRRRVGKVVGRRKEEAENSKTPA